MTKITVLIYLYYHWQTGAFTQTEFIGTFSLLLPSLAAFLPAIIGGFGSHQSPDFRPENRHISGPLVNIAIWLFLIYWVLLIIAITSKAKTQITFTSMIIFLTIIEVVLG